MRSFVLSICACVLFAACGSSKPSAPKATPTSTAPAQVFVISTSAGMSLLRTVAADYENGDGADVPLKCARGTLQLSIDGLVDAVGGDKVGALTADSKTIDKICDSAEANGWPSVRDAVLKAIGQ